MRIVIDLQGAQSESRFRGIGRYSLSLALEMAKNPAGHEIWIALNGKLDESVPSLRAAFSKVIPAQRIRTFDVPCGTSPTPWNARASELIRESWLTSLNPDVVLISSMFEGPWAGAVTSIGATEKTYKTAVIFYDLIPLLNEDVYLPTAELKAYYFRKIDSLKKADLLLSISESSGQEAHEHLGIDKGQISNISAAIGDQFKPSKMEPEVYAQMLNGLTIAGEFILYAPGGFDPRKNFARIIEAYSLLDAELRTKHQLVIASKLHPTQRDELESLTKRFGLTAQEVVLTGYVTDDELVALYSHAKLFVFPSTHEGFGLPVLEAMACGAAVIGSNCSSVPEVIGLEDALFDPFSVESIQTKMTQALVDEQLREKLIGNAAARTAVFGWEASAAKAISAIESLITQPASNHPPVDPQHVIRQLASLTDSSPSHQDLLQTSKSIAYNFSERETGQLLLDVSSIVHSDARSGIQRVVRSLLQELIISPPSGFEVRPIYFETGTYYYANTFGTTHGAQGLPEHNGPIDYVQGDKYLSLDLNMHLANELYPLHAQMQVMGVEINYIVYDILLIHRPDWWLEPNPVYFRNWLEKIALAGDNLFCISAAVAEEVQEWLAANPPARVDGPPAVSSFHLGADIASSVPSSGLPTDALMTLAQFKLRTSFLMVSTIEPRKGHAQTLAAFEELWAAGIDLNLVIVGKRGWLVDNLVARLEAHPERNSRLFWLEGISDEYLEQVYNACTCLIAASEGEGFGLPLIEAAQKGLPMIVRDLPVFREVAGTHATYFQGLEPAVLAAAISDWLAAHKAGEHPASDQMPWLTWKNSSEQLKQLLASQRQLSV